MLYPNSTVGKNYGIAPILEDRVILYPNSAVIGYSTIKKGSVILQGSSVINKNTEENKLVFQGNEGKPIFKESKRDFFADFFYE